MILVTGASGFIGSHVAQQLLDAGRRVRTIVLRNGSDAPGHWQRESRDVAADFLRAFGDESATVPPLTAVIVAGDADNTGARSVTHVANLSFAP